MTKKRLVVAASLAAFACLVLGILAMLPASSGPTKLKFDRIEMGMTKAQIEDIFNRTGAEHHYWSLIWRGDDGDVTVRFDHTNQAIDKFWTAHPDPFIQKLRRWFRLR